MINIICALDCEAKSIIHHYGLKRNNKVKFKLYNNTEINLVVAGVGKVNCEFAVEQLAQHHQTSSSWLNIGIAGHKDLAVGTGRLIHKIIYANTFLYPPRLNKKMVNIDSISLRTVDKPEKCYPDSCAYDMEAIFFYQAAIKHQTSELIQCYKIISDNAFSPTENINAKNVTALVNENLAAISKIINELSALQKIPSVVENIISIEKLTKNYHFTQYQKHHLLRLLKRLSLIEKNDTPDESIPALKDGSQVIFWLQEKLKELPVKI